MIAIQELPSWEGPKPIESEEKSIINAIHSLPAGQYVMKISPTKPDGTSSNRATDTLAKYLRV